MGDISIVIGRSQLARLRCVLPRTVELEWSRDGGHATVRGLTLEQVTAITQRHMATSGANVAIVDDAEFPRYDADTDLFLWHESERGEIVCRIVTVADDDLRRRLQACLAPGYTHTCTDLPLTPSYLFVWHSIVFGPDPTAIPAADPVEFAAINYNACVALRARGDEHTVVGFHYDELLRVAESARTVDAALARRIVPDSAPHYAYTMRGLREFVERKRVNSSSKK
jgi:diadenosine tetraphosphatase ApaH/serine/threonine PP2A family protein phosphatase